MVSAGEMSPRPQLGSHAWLPCRPAGEGPLPTAVGTELLSKGISAGAPLPFSGGGGPGGSRWPRCCQGNRAVGWGIWLEGGVVSHLLLPLGGVGPPKGGTTSVGWALSPSRWVGRQGGGVVPSCQAGATYLRHHGQPQQVADAAYGGNEDLPVKALP